MVRTVTNHHHLHDEDEDYEDFISRTTDGSSQKEGRSNDLKATSHRSKHSQTEQRRRSKINERFQILSDLIPQNDQKRDRASFLLEVIQYIQFLQEKLQVYEGTHQGWSPEPTKLMPWRQSSGLDNVADQSQAINNGSVDDDHDANQAVSVDFPLPQHTFEDAPSNTHQSSFPDVELLSSSHSQPHTWNSSEVEVASISNAYSRGLLNNLARELGSSGVDLSQASISVQFDIKRGTNSNAASTSSGIKDKNVLSTGYQARTTCGVRKGDDDICNQANKRPRNEDNQ